MTWALVTGASRGIGFFYAQHLAARGYNILAVSNEEQQLADLESAIEQRYEVKVVTLCRDLSRETAARELYDFATQRNMQVDVLINNAGVFIFDDVTEIVVGRIETMLRLHIQTTTLLCRYFGAAMKQRHVGYILNMASMAAWMPFPGIALYSATKSYLLTFTKALHNELHDYGVNVTAICPGAVATDLYNLSKRYQRLAVHLGIMMSPDRLARKGLRALFGGRRSTVPGCMNRTLVGLTWLIPNWAVRAIKRHATFYRYGRR